MDDEVLKHLNKLNAEAVGLALKLCETKKPGDVVHIIATASALVAAAICRNAPNEKAFKGQVKRTLDQIHTAGYKQTNAASFGESAARFVQAIENAIGTEDHAKH
jgi:hypothetical protein